MLTQVEVKILDFIISDIDGSSMLVTGELGVSDSSSTRRTDISFIISA